MSRKDFVAIAAAIAQIRDESERERTARLVGEVCSRSNGRFDWSRFLNACGVSQ